MEITQYVVIIQNVNIEERYNSFFFVIKKRAFNQQVKNNITKFDDDFMFQLSEYEYNSLRSNFLTSSLNDNYGGRRYNPYVFTEHR